MTMPVVRRRSYLDWLRGLAVVIMIFAHTTDSWTRASDRGSALYELTVRISGMAAPLFLYLAGFSVALVAEQARGRGSTVWRAGRSMRRRGWAILGLALLFRLQAWILSPGATLSGVLKVDILNIMGPAIVLAATVWSLGSTPWRRGLMLGASACAFSLLTPLVRASTAIGQLPDWIEWYLRPPQRSWFALFPWAGLLLAGTLVGDILARTRDDQAERRALILLAYAGTAISLASFLGSYLPSLYAETSFWTTSASYFFLRVGLMTALLPLAWRWRRSRVREQSSPLEQMGRTSLFIYWVHVEIVYGILTWPLQRALPLGWALAAFAVFSVLVFQASRWKTRVVAGWRAPRPVRRPSPEFVPET